MTANFVRAKALEEIEAVLGLPYEYANSDDEGDHLRIMTIGHVWGIVTFAKELLKEIEDERG